jgi:hypothetical protein
MEAWLEAEYNTGVATGEFFVPLPRRTIWDPGHFFEFRHGRQWGYAGDYGEEIGMQLIRRWLPWLLAVSLSAAPSASRVAAVEETAGGTIFLPLVARNYDPVAGLRRIHAPFFNVADITGQKFSEMAIFWFGRVSWSDNYTDVRVAYNAGELVIYTATFDRQLWHNNTASTAGTRSACISTWLAPSAVRPPHPAIVSSPNSTMAVRFPPHPRRRIAAMEPVGFPRPLRSRPLLAGEGTRSITTMTPVIAAGR